MKKIGNRYAWLFLGLGLGTLLGISACRATVAGDPDRPIKIEAHITLDIRQVKEEAHSIEDMVSGGSPAGQKQSFINEVGASVALAEEAPLSPEGQQAIANRRSRFAQIRAYKSQGFIGEDNQGHVAVLAGGPDVQVLVEAENRDRETIYREKVKEKNLAESAIATIRATFAQEHRERAKSGDKIQLLSGEWTTK